MEETSPALAWQEEHELLLPEHCTGSAGSQLQAISFCLTNTGLSKHKSSLSVHVATRMWPCTLRCPVCAQVNQLCGRDSKLLSWRKTKRKNHV